MTPAKTEDAERSTAANNVINRVPKERRGMSLQYDRNRTRPGVRGSDELVILILFVVV